MAENIETRVGNLETKAAIHDEKFDAFLRSMEDFKAEMRDFKQEMRQQNEMRAKEISDLRKKQDADMTSIRNEIQGVGREVRNLCLTFAIGIGAMFLTVVYTIIRGG